MESLVLTKNYPFIIIIFFCFLACVMSSLSKFKFKSMKSTNEEDAFEGFSPEDFSQSTFYSNSKLATLKEIIKELDPQYIFKNTNICDFGGFTDDDISERESDTMYYNVCSH